MRREMANNTIYFFMVMGLYVLCGIIAAIIYYICSKIHIIDELETYVYMYVIGLGWISLVISLVDLFITLCYYIDDKIKNRKDEE